jgi:simple sugar transport system substrate-binding protein
MIKGRKLLVVLLCAVFMIGMIGTQAFAAPKYKFVFLCHGGEENTFWASVYSGMVEAAKTLDVDAVMFRPTTEGNLNQQFAQFKAALAQKPDGIVTTIPHPTMFNDLVKQAIDMGIPVICSNTDHPDGAKGNARLSYIGQDLEVAGYNLAKALSQYFPKGKKNHVLIGVEGPGLVWAESRAHGMIRFLDELGGVTYEKLDIGMDPAQEQSRILAYFKAHPETTVMLDVGGLGPTAATQALKNLGKKPGEIPIGGFDLLPALLQNIKEGYVQMTIDQQPFLQGYLPIVQLYMMKKYGFSAWDVNTGNAIVDKSNVDQIVELSKKRIR